MEGKNWIGVEFLNCWHKKGIFKDEGARRRVVLFGKGSRKRMKEPIVFIH
jgi:hypothetical protein